MPSINIDHAGDRALKLKAMALAYRMPSIILAPKRTPEGFPLLYDIYIDGEWIGSQPTRGDCYARIEQWEKQYGRSS